MKRDLTLFLNDIHDNAERVLKFVEGISYEEFVNDEKTIYAVTRALEIIGEAVKHIPANLRKKYPDIEWQNIRGLRNVIAHEYFGIDYTMVWSIIAHKLPPLIIEMKRMLEDNKISQDKLKFNIK